MRKFVMVCTGNTCRSPMAEAMLRALQPGIDVSSAGVATADGLPASEGAIREMARRGLSLADHASRVLRSEDVQGAQVLCMTRSHLRMVQMMFPQAQADTLMHFAGLSGDVADPYGGGENEYRAAADMILAALQAMLRAGKTE